MFSGNVKIKRAGNAGKRCNCSDCRDDRCVKEKIDERKRNHDFKEQLREFKTSTLS